MITSKTYNMGEGMSFIESPELAFTPVYLVKREGTQHDKYLSGDSNRTYDLDSPLGRVSFPVPANPGGEKVFVLFKKTSPVIDPIPGVCVAAGFENSLPNGILGVPYTASLSLLGTGPFTISSEALPSWMSAAIVVDTVQFTGTPDATGVAGVTIQVENCDGFPADFTQAISIMPPTINFFFEASGAGVVVGGVENIDLVMVGTFPIVAPGTASGYHIDFTGAIKVNINSIVFPMNLRLMKNGLQIEFIPVDTAGEYTFSTQTFLEADELKIILN